MKINMINFGLRIFTIFVLNLSITGCVLPTVERYTPLQPSDYEERKQPAETYQGSPNELFEKGYLLIGYMDYTINVQTCYQDNTCENHSDDTEISTSLMSSAAERGADKVIVLSTKLELVPSNKSICNYYNTSTYTDKDGKTHTMTTCASYSNYPGHRESWQRRALFFRHEPNKDNAEKNYVAVKKAMESLEEASSEPQQANPDKETNGLTEDLKGAEEPIDDYGAQLITAIDAGNQEFLQKQLQSETLSAWEKKHQINLLIIAYFRNATPAFRYLESHPHSWAIQTEKGYNAYHAAIGFSDPESLKNLEQHHPYLIKTDEKFTEIVGRSISMAKNPAVVPYLKQKQYDMNLKIAPERCAVLHHAVLAENLPIIEALIKAGANIEEKCNDGSTPILLASTVSKPDTLKFLLSLNANILATDIDGNTALHYAAIKSSEETLRHLLTLPRLAVQQKNAKGVDACVVAISQKNWQAVAPLLEKGALCQFPTEEQSIAAIGLLMREGSASALKAYMKKINAFDYPLGGKAELYGSYCAEVCNQEKMEALIDLGLSTRRTYYGKSLLTTAQNKNNDGAMVAILRKSYTDPKALSDNFMLKNAIIRGNSKFVNAVRQAQGHSF